MNQAIGQVLPLAVAVSISPIPIIAVVLMLGTPRARLNGPAFVLGWIVGLGALGTLVLLVSSSVDASEDSEPAAWVSWFMLALGALVLLLALKQWRGRNAAKEQPKWMQTVDRFTPVRAFGMGVLLSGVNPKNLLLTVAAAAAIAATGISAAQQELALAVFVVFGTLGPAIPVALYFVPGERSKKLLDGLNSWMAANNAVIMAVLLLVIGVKLVGDGIAGL
jgi:threonine/homoserine/homoserine lactone efflux protein